MTETPYTQDLFYDSSLLTFEQKTNLLKEARRLCRTWRVDVLDCDKSFASQRIDMSFDDIMTRFKENSHFVFVNRKGFKPEGYVLEAGFRAGSRVDYFLWIHLDEKYIGHFLKKYPLREWAKHEALK